MIDDVGCCPDRNVPNEYPVRKLLSDKWKNSWNDEKKKLENRGCANYLPHYQHLRTLVWQNLQSEQGVFIWQICPPHAKLSFWWNRNLNRGCSLDQCFRWRWCLYCYSCEARLLLALCKEKARRWTTKDTTIPVVSVVSGKCLFVPQPQAKENSFETVGTA